MTKIMLYGTVGIDVDADYINAALADADDDIELRINSGGGDVFDGQAIFSLLTSYKRRTGRRVLTYIDSIAASVASVIAMAGDEINISSNAMMMVHNPWTPMAAGDADELRQLAGVLDKVRETLITVYMGRTGLERDTVEDFMDNETWFTAEEAVGLGFADNVLDASEVIAACVRGFDYGNVPRDLVAQTPALPAVPTAASFQRRNLAGVQLWLNQQKALSR